MSRDFVEIQSSHEIHNNKTRNRDKKIKQQDKPRIKSGPRLWKALNTVYTL